MRTSPIQPGTKVFDETGREAGHVARCNETAFLVMRHSGRPRFVPVGYDEWTPVKGGIRVDRAILTCTEALQDGEPVHGAGPERPRRAA